MVRLLYGTDSAEVSRREEAGQLNAGSNEAVLRRLLERVGMSRLLAPGEDLMTADGQLKGSCVCPTARTTICCSWCRGCSGTRWPMTARGCG